MVIGNVGWGIAHVMLASCDGDEHDLMHENKRRTMESHSFP